MTVDRAELLSRLSPAKRALLLRALQKEVAQSSAGRNITRRSQSGPIPLSFSQQGLWFVSQVDPTTPLYNVPESIQLSGPLNVEALEQSLNEIIRRHDALRTSFTVVERQPVQICTQFRRLSLKIVDLRNLPATERESSACRLLEAEARRPFDLTKDLLLRATLLWLDQEDYWILLTLHHIVADGWSMGILIRETASLYEAFAQGNVSPLSELPIQYSDFTQWQREWLQGERLAALLDYWKQQLANAPPLRLPADRSRSAHATLEGARQSFTIPQTLSNAVKRLSDSEGVTLFMTLLAAFEVLLYRYTQQDDIVIGTAIANRHHGETENLIGFFVNMLVLRTKISGKLTFREVLQRVREVALDAYEHQDLPFDKLVEELQPERQLNRNPLFQVVFAVHSGLAPALDLPQLKVRQLPATSKTSKYDLSLEFIETENTLTGFREYSTELFDEETITRLQVHYQTLLEALVSNPEQSIARLQLLPGAEEYKLLVEWNNEQAYPTEQCLHELVASQVERNPDAVALVFEDQPVTYAELDQRANQLAQYLRNLGVGPETLVAIFMDRSVEMLVGLLAVLKANGAYVPIDPAYPAERVAFILGDTAAPVLVTQQSLLPALPPHSARIVCIDEEREEIARFGTEPLVNNASPDNLAYIIYTSGSTGKPKGVMVTHRNVVRLFAATHDHFAFDEHDVWTLFHSYAFDFSVWEMWGALLYGGRLVIVPYWASRSPEGFYELLCRERVTVLNQTPSAFRQLSQIDERSTSDAQQALALRLVIFGGEALDFESLGQWFRDHGDERPQLVNMYGITETTVHVTERRVRMADRGSGSLIGCPISDLRGYVLDQQMELLPTGVPGELYVGGPGVARGYLHRPELTADRFIPDPFSREQGARLYRTGDLVRYRGTGDLEYLGRVDQQVKIRGFRIEPGEIETALEQHDEVREAVVISNEEVAGEPRLIAYIVPAPISEREQQAGSAELSAEQVSQWEMVFNENYGQPISQPDPTFNITGWNNSYTGKPFAEEEMRDWVEQTVKRILSLRPQKVLEIGCGTGLLLLRLAEHCSRYVGTDFSPIALDYIQQTLSLCGEHLPQLELLHRRADNFTGFEPGAFDLVILNSIVQYFPGIDYLLKVIEGAVNVVRSGGFIFIGDVRSLPLLEAFHLSVQLHQAPPSLPVAQLEQRVKRHMAQEEELIVEPSFFAALQQHFPQISDVHVLLKRGPYHNEMTQFRYDVILRLGESQPASAVFPECLNETQPERLTLTNVPNVQALSAVKALELLAGEQRPETVGDLRELLDQVRPDDNVDPEDVAVLSTNGRPKPWAKYANNPLEGRFTRRLVPKLRSLLQEQLPEYMVPSAFVLMESMPLTAHGKINQKALPAPEQARPELEDIYVAPRTQTEKELAATFAHILGITQVGLHDNFFELGGHSLLATQLLSRIRETFPEKEISLRQIFESPTVAGLARELAATGNAEQYPTIPALVPAARNGGLPLSFAQQRIWFLHRLEPDSPAYNMPAALRLTGDLNLTALHQSLSEIVRRHEALRTVFAAVDGRPVQIVTEKSDLHLNVIDLSRLKTDEQDQEVKRLARLEAHRPFDLTRCPLLRVTLLRLGDRDQVVLVTMHHIISDGWSVAILMKEVMRLYEAYRSGKPSPLSELKIQYADFAVWQRDWLEGDVLEEKLAAWKAQFGEQLSILELPADHVSTTSGPTRAAIQRLVLTNELFQALESLSQREGATLFMTMLTAFECLLHRYSGQEDMVVGTAIANRNRSEIEELIGFFVNMLVVRTDLSGNPTFRQLLTRVREATLATYLLEDLPFEKLVETLRPDRSVSGTSLLKLVFVHQSVPMMAFSLAGLTLTPLELNNELIHFDLMVEIADSEAGLSVVLTYNTNLFKPETIDRILTHYEALLQSVVAQPEQRLLDIPLLLTGSQNAPSLPSKLPQSYEQDHFVFGLE